jgi:hypothetical protein
MNSLKYILAKAMVKRSVKGSDFDPVAAETNFSVDPVTPEYNNSYYFTAHDSDGKAVIMRLAARGTGAMELWFSLHIPGMGNYSVAANLQNKLKSFDDGPLKLACIEPVRKWKIVFAGEVHGEKDPCRVEFDALLSSDYPVFHFTNDMKPSVMAQALAAEKWNGVFFSTLRKMHQHHYEQGGSLKGCLTIDGKLFDLSMRFLRDHSFGPRSWAAMDRHLWLSNCLSNGDFINLSLPEYPFIRITAGFYARGGSYSSVLRSTPYAKIAPHGQPPREFSYQLDIDNGNKVDIICRRGDGFTWLMGGAYRVFEWVSEFEVNGIRGRGICEFGYNISRYDYGTL